MEIKGFNVILDNQPCKFLNTKTGLCTDYKNRKKNFKYCTGEANDEMFDVGALPEECLILKQLGKKEARPKIKINKIIHLLKQPDVLLYNYWNNYPNLTEFYENNYNKLGIKKIKMEV